jgi:NAD(P)-dependent dehydrogenase (short-subunit alcohol dehydrogenase family)
MRLTDQVAVVIGAGGGMGAAICAAFAREGAAVAAADVSTDRLAHIDAGVRLAVDATDAAALDGLREELQRQLGTPTILVNCLGVWHSESYDAVTAADWHAVIDGNLTAAWNSCRAFLPAMVERGGGAVVNFASTAGEYGSIRPAAHYAAAKGGIIAMSKSLAREVAPRVRVNVVSPGPVDTPMLDAGGDAGKAHIASRTLVARLGTPEDMADACVYLTSPESTFVTGHVLRVNGGALI